MQELLGQEFKVHPAIVTTPLDTIVLEPSVIDSSQNIQISLYITYYSYLRFESSSQQYSIHSITAADCRTEVLTGPSKFENDDIFGQAEVSGARIVFARLRFDQAFRHWEANRPEGLILCPSHLKSQELRNDCGFTTTKVVVPSVSWSTALLIKI